MEDKTILYSTYQNTDLLNTGWRWGLLQGSTTFDNFDGPDVTLLVCFVTRHFPPFFLLKWVRWATAAIYVFLTSLPPTYILQDRLAAIWVKNSLMVWYLLCLLCQNYQLLSHNFTSNLFAQSTSRLCRGVRNMQNAIMFKERQIIKFGFVMELHLWRFLTGLIRDGVIFEPFICSSMKLGQMDIVRVCY